MKDNAIGPDGNPNSAWLATGEEGVTSLSQAGDALAGGVKPPLWFYQSILLFAPNGEETEDTIRECIRNASNTRPLAMKNTDNKIVAAVANRKLTGPIAKLAHKV